MHVKSKWQFKNSSLEKSRKSFGISDHMSQEKIAFSLYSHPVKTTMLFLNVMLVLYTEAKLFGIALGQFFTLQCPIRIVNKLSKVLTLKEFKMHVSADLKRDRKCLLHLLETFWEFLEFEFILTSLRLREDALFQLSPSCRVRTEFVDNDKCKQIPFDN